MKSTSFYRQLADRVAEFGGYWNAHLHLDRAGTLNDAYLEPSAHRVLENSHISLHEKHGLINTLHAGPAYEADDLRRRISETIETMIAVGTTRADTLVDVTADRVGLSALEVLQSVQRECAPRLDLRIGAYSPLGFRDDEPERWEIMEAGADCADFIAALPEADDVVDYPEHIGFEEHCRRMLHLGQKRNQLIHVHTDQRNDPRESGTEQLLDAIRAYGAPNSTSGEPMVWAVHAISPAAYDEARFERLVAGLLECNVGIVCCPSAAIGMRQLRSLSTPTHNSIPRVLELIAAGVQVRLASDNIADICSPSTTPDLTDEVFILSAALRFYHVDILARLASGSPLTAPEREVVQEHLDQNKIEIARACRRYASPTPTPTPTPTPSR